MLVQIVQIAERMRGVRQRDQIRQERHLQRGARQ